VGVQEVRWEGGSTEQAGDYTSYYGKGNENLELGTGFFVRKRIISAAYGLLVGKREGKRPLGGWIILGWILERWDGVM
jgi:hypothetical protein